MWLRNEVCQALLSPYCRCQGISYTGTARGIADRSTSKTRFWGRFALRNIIRSGVPEVVCMRISGHKTRSVFDRNYIVSERDLAEAAREIESVSLSYIKAREPEGA